MPFRRPAPDSVVRILFVAATVVGVLGARSLVLPGFLAARPCSVECFQALFLFPMVAAGVCLGLGKWRQFVLLAIASQLVHAYAMLYWVAPLFFLRRMDWYEQSSWALLLRGWPTGHVIEAGLAFAVVVILTQRHPWPAPGEVRARVSDEGCGRRP